MKLVSAEPYILTPLTPHESLHPGQGHIGITSVIQDLGQSLGRIKRYDTPMPKAMQSAYGEMGYCFEDALEAEYKRRQAIRRSQEEPLLRQQKFCHEGFHMIPDGFVPKLLIDEYKLTFKKRPKDDVVLDEMWAWGMQTHCYAHLLQIFEVHFYVAWLERRPEVVHYTYQFEPKEAKRAWDMAQRHRKLMLKKTKVKRDKTLE